MSTPQTMPTAQDKAIYESMMTERKKISHNVFKAGVICAGIIAITLLVMAATLV